MGYILDLINSSAEQVKIEKAFYIQYKAGKSGFRIQLDIHQSRYLRNIVPIQPPILTAAVIKKQKAEKKAEKEQANFKTFNQRSVHKFEYKQDQLIKKWEYTDSNCPNNQRHC